MEHQYDVIALDADDWREVRRMVQLLHGIEGPFVAQIIEAHLDLFANQNGRQPVTGIYGIAFPVSLVRIIRNTAEWVAHDRKRGFLPPLT